MALHTPPSPRGRCLRAGLSTALLWVVVEAGLRWTGLGLVLWWDAARAPVTVGTLFWANVVAVIPPLLVLAWLVARRVRRDGLTWTDLGYRPWRVGVWPAAGAAAAALGTVLAIEPWEDALFPNAARQHLWDEGRRLAGPLIGLLAVPVNGLLGPLVEEFAWRGYIQTRMILALGSSTGIVATALLFAAKHAVVDVTLSRSVTVTVVAFVLGIVGARWGTQASTVTHMAANAVATLVVLVLDPLLPGLFS
ncbi:MAG: CPBP family intramembrane glutamic endopeptidase [Armatimonadota bacterium]|nr:CPBP family intramembrane glutamic endopeptidase [Armatimonadota bacterium]MDR7485267.1 CPBP family intramembrane glutamic endopeptidase [Armatimonadota bacterium]MDR7533895.1 CPBP family intramembrane glutamic endopeptidase [Armatimonadota bacterium]MDR7537143.1 CPBP family intramembrane glutamic endopeptidase [Armatimonadota bacterium]